MKKPDHKLPALVALSNLIAAMESGSRMADLDQIARALLKFVWTETAEGREVAAVDIVSGLAKIASPVTLSARIGQLVDAGWLKKSESEAHHRRKAIVLTSKAIEEVQILSKALEKKLNLTGW